jgi:hypothetical protein
MVMDQVMRTWLTAQLARASGKSALAEALRYALRHWPGLVLFLEDGRLELDTNTIERAIQPVALAARTLSLRARMVEPATGRSWRA